MYDCVCCVCLNFLDNTVQGCEHFLSLERTYVPLRHHLAWTSKVLDVNKANYKFLFSVEPCVREEILLANNNITVSCKQICSQALHFYQKLQAKRMKFRPTSFQKPLFLAFHQVTRQSCWVGGHYNRVFSGRNYMKIGFSSQRREML